MIKFVRMRNCQSFQDVIYPLASDKLNVLVAQNDTGKSILYKVLKLAGCPDYYSDADRRDLIRRGADYAQVTFQFTDDSMAVMRIQKDGVLYCWVESIAEPFSWSLEPPIEMVDRIGLLVSPTEPFIANIVDMDQGLLLVDSRLASNYELVKILATCEDLDTIMERVDPLIKEFREVVIRETDSLNMVEGQLKEMEYIDVVALETKVEASEACIAVGDVLCNLTECIEKLPKLPGGSIDFEKAMTVLEGCECLEKVRGLIESMPEIPNEVDEVPIEVLGAMEAAREMMEKIETLKEELPVSLASSLDILARLRDCVKNIESVGAEPPDERLVSTLSALEGVLGCFSSIQECKGLDESIAELELLFSQSGQSVECPIYGKVVFDGKECMADS